MTWSTILQLIFSGLAIGAIYGLVALSYNVIFNTSNVINFAQGELIVIGALSGVSFWVVSGTPFYLALTASVAVVVVLALINEYVAVRPIADVTRNFAWIMSTFGLGIAMRQLSYLIWGTSPLPFPNFIGTDAPVSIAGIRILPQELGIIVVGVAITIALEVFRRRTIYGTAMRAVAADRGTASLMGVNPDHIVYLSWAISGIIATIAGYMVAPITFADPHMGIVLGIKGFIAMVIGGLGFAVGGFLGGLVLGLLEAIATTLFAAVWKDVIVFAALIILMMVKPSGLFTGFRSRA